MEFAQLESCVRDELNIQADRAMAVLDPLKVVITTLPEDYCEQLPAENNPELPERGSRNIAFSREIYIEREDFMEEPVKGFRRLIPGGEVRLKYAYIIRCDEVVKDADGQILELHCSHDPNSKSGQDTSGKKVKGTIQWVEAKTAVPVELRLYDLLFTKANPDDVEEGQFFTDFVNPKSLVIPERAVAEASLAQAEVGIPYQFLRTGYFVKDRDSKEGNLVFNRIVSLKKSNWQK